MLPYLPHPVASHQESCPIEEPNPNGQTIQGTTRVLSHVTGNTGARRAHRPHPKPPFSKQRVTANPGQVQADRGVTVLTSTVRTTVKATGMILSTKKIQHKCKYFMYMIGIQENVKSKISLVR